MTDARSRPCSATRLGVDRVVWLADGDRRGRRRPTATSTTSSRSPRRAGRCSRAATIPTNPNHAIALDNRRRLEGGGHRRSSRSRRCRTRTVDGRRLPVPYVNFYVANGVVVVPRQRCRRRRGCARHDRAQYPGREVVGGRGRGARVRWRRRALHHPTGPGRAVIVRTAFDLLDSPARVDAPPEAPVARRHSCRSAGAPIRARTKPRSARASRVAAGERCAARLPAGADARRRTSRSRPTGPAARGRRRTGAASRRSDARVRAPTCAADDRVRCTRRSTSAPTTAALGLQHRDLCRARRHAARPDAQDAPPGHRRATTRTSTSGSATPAIPSSTSPGRRVGFPTCWDEWFPEVARALRARRAPR